MTLGSGGVPDPADDIRATAALRCAVVRVLMCWMDVRGSTPAKPKQPGSTVKSGLTGSSDLGEGGDPDATATCRVYDGDELLTTINVTYPDLTVDVYELVRDRTLAVPQIVSFTDNGVSTTPVYMPIDLFLGPLSPLIRLTR